MNTWIIIKKNTVEVMGFYSSEDKKDFSGNNSYLGEPECVHIKLPEGLDPAEIIVDLVDGEYVFSLNEELHTANVNFRNSIGNDYVNKRLQEYPSIGDQLDLLYWDKVNDTDNWQELIAGIKAKYPKN